MLGLLHLWSNTLVPSDPPAYNNGGGLAGSEDYVTVVSIALRDIQDREGEREMYTYRDRFNVYTMEGCLDMPQTVPRCPELLLPSNMAVLDCDAID